MPLLVLAPLVAFVLAISSVRTRRSSAYLAMLGAIVMLILTALAAWGLTKKSTPFFVTWPYINLPVAFRGPANFQGFAIDLTLRVDHLTVVALLVVEVCVIGALGWHQVMGRSEPGAARFHAIVSALLFACAGVLVSWDLAELVAFWGLAGAMTYLLLGHRWGADDPARRARVALILPFATDLSLLCGIAWLYARYGVQNLNTLLPILHTNPGWTVRSLVVASILLFVGVAGRLALWPLNSWATQTAATSPPAGSAIVQALWSVLAIVVLYRLMPIFVAANAQTLQGCLYACAAAAILAPLLALVGNEARRSIALLGSGLAALGAAIVIHGFQDPHFTFAVAGAACVLAAAPARAAGVLAASAIANAMRTEDVGEMGDAWRRMPWSSVALLAAGLVLGLSAAGGLAFAVSSRSRLGVALGEAVLLISIAALRIFLAASIGPLRRRRAFEPDRVREAPQGSIGWPYWLVVAGAALLVVSLIPGWLDFLDGHKHAAPAAGAYVIWAAAAIIGFAAAAFAYSRNKDGALRVSAVSGDWLAGLAFAGSAAFERFVALPAVEISGRAEDWIPAGDDRLGRAVIASGRLALAATRGPALALLILLAVLVTLAVGVISPGVFR